MGSVCFKQSLTWAAEMRARQRNIFEVSKNGLLVFLQCLIIRCPGVLGAAVVMVSKVRRIVRASEGGTGNALLARTCRESDFDQTIIGGRVLGIQYQCITSRAGDSECPLQGSQTQLIAREHGGNATDLPQISGNTECLSGRLWGLCPCWHVLRVSTQGGLAHLLHSRDSRDRS